LKTTRVIGLLKVWAVAVLLCGAVAATAAENSPPPKKTGPQAAPAAKPAASATPAATSEAPSKDSVSKTSEPPGEEDAEGGKGDAKGTAAGLPIPRFVSLRTNPINLRTGPGVRYPVDWVYVRRHLPVEVIGEFDTWRQLRDKDGTEGWVHQSMISGKRSAIVTQEPRPLKRTGEDGAETIATLEQGVIVNLQRCPAATVYCRVEVNGLQGWLKRDQLWGIYPDETLE
jgi:SH3-like domain-containing protein